MTISGILHPYTPAKGGRCIFPIRKADGTFTACGKMRGLHVDSIDTIVVDSGGNVIDGNHRLAAAQAMGIPVVLEVVEG